MTHRSAAPASLCSFRATRKRESFPAATIARLSFQNNRTAKAIRLQGRPLSGAHRVKLRPSILLRGHGAADRIVRPPDAGAIKSAVSSTRAPNPMHQPAEVGLGNTGALLSLDGWSFSS